MTQKLDYSREDAMEILNNVNFSDEEKRSQYEEYMSELKKTRKNAIVTKLNDLAREIPTITKDIYISVLKKYDNDDLSIPFEVIESELSTFEKDMRKKYDEYLASQKEEEEEILPDVTKEENEDLESMTFDDTIFDAPKVEEKEDEEELKPSFSLTSEMSVLNEEPELLAKPLFNEEDDSMEVMPEETLGSEKKEMNRIYKELIDSMLPYQDEETGMWYQVVNRGGIHPNYLETSGSAIFAYAIMKSVRLGFLDGSYFAYGKKAFEGICRTYLSEENGELQLGGICLVAGLGNKEMREGTFDYYMREPIVKNEAKGVAPLILAYIELMYQHQEAEV